MDLNDLRNIDFKNVGELPLAIKAVLLLAILLGVVFLGAALVWKPMLDELEQVRTEEWGPDKKSGLRGTFESKLALAANLEGYKQQLKEAEQKSNILLQQLPDKSQMDGLLADINQAGIGRGLEFELFKPGQEKPSALYAELPITIRVLGNYHELGAFAADVAKMPRIVTLENIAIGAATKDAKAVPGKLAMDAVARTYRALDKSEIQPVGKKKAPPKPAGGEKGPAGAAHK
ncbi:MAG: type 4a pilus biogenesis protein PilO [Methylophilaceae bacterium]|nr:type 4a pilus biogenesis protein PilO [Methylophilaceae bacterium]